ncbi:SMC-Scp complex subunit ScpB [Bifidobacterium callimiconis]|uniref:SMC-Scp complex subunit ScpB n=1 Tax=Bifidobacterium callimiconis TaxID=2306973 RepID=A0A430FCV9_9BIFI|nr:SMC-Scp complex subunit ScpB [Bifidobacterium callimiconis]MBT1176776.1 SMC-Scp complex subunit ScpB [Bifidobacterium callimiconis]RSX50676.1 SMC-Scp complex subunit ScpB [Bifidobacterium callimiconis]
MVNVDEFPGGLAACLESVLMVTDHPLTEDALATVFGVDADRVAQVLETLRDDYDGVDGARRRGFELRHTVRGWRLASRQEMESVVEAFINDGRTARLSQAAMETLAIIAYQQPITRARISTIRGVSSDGVIRSLTLHGLVEERGNDPDSHAALLVTTDLFLENMGLDGLDRLPSLAPFLPESASAVESAGQESVKQ